MHGRGKVLIVLQIAILFLWSFAAAPAEDPAVFPLTESSILDSMGGSPDDAESEMYMFRVASTQGATCTTKPTPDVVYPKLVSPTPLYGRLPLTTRGEEGEQVDFVIDESQPGTEPAVKDEPSLLRQLSELLTGSKASAQRATKYDLLYVDVNRDRDLTNDPPLRPIKQRPKMFSEAGQDSSPVVFDYLDIQPAGEATPTTKPLRLLPWLNAVETEEAYLVVMTTGVRKGRIRIGDSSYEAVMGTSMEGQANLLVRRESSADTAASKQPWRMLGLGLQQAEGKFYELTASPAGDQLTVALYGGPMGELRLEAGDRKVDQFAAAGALQTSTGSVVWLGEPENYYSEQRVRTIQLPVGDYQLSYFTVACGNLLVRLSADYRTPQLAEGSTTQPSAFPIAIRADQPFALKFSDRPAMTFISPVAGSNQLFRCGTEISFRALLVDPAINSIVRGLDDATQKTGERQYMGEDGQLQTLTMYASLAPQVSITNSTGKEVASGPMPFG